MRLFYLFASLIFLCSFQISHAQFTTLGSSSEFEEYESGHLKVLSLKNKTSALVHFTLKKGINLKVFSEDFKLQLEKYIEPEVAYNLKRGEVLGVFETNGNITAIYYSFINRKPRIYRMVIAPKDGTVVSEEEIGVLEDVNIGTGFAVAFGKVPAPTFYLRKDESSENYAIALYNTMASDRNKRIEIVHYNSQHQELSRAFNQSPENDYKYMEFLDMVIFGDQKVMVSTIGKNTRTSGGDRNGALLIGTLEKGANQLDLHEIDYVNAAHIESGLLKYNKHVGELYLLSMEKQRVKRGTTYYSVQLSIISEDLRIRTKSISPEKIQSIATNQYRKKDQFMATPQNLFINDDGSFVILFEEIRVEIIQSSRRESTRTFLEDVGVIRYDKNGNEIGAAYVPKSHLILEHIPEDMYYAKNQLKGVHLSWGFQWKSFYYINAGETGYLLFNDIAKNQDKIEDKKKVTTIQSVGDSEAYVFDLKNSNTIPERKSVLQQDGKNKSLALFSGAHYDPETKILTTVVTTPKKRGANSRLVWLKVD